MTVLNSESCENEGLMHAARLMLLSARTAPKSGGVDDVLTAIALGKEKDSIAEEMEKIAEERKITGFKRDAKNVRDSAAALLIGVRGTKSYKAIPRPNCGACGYSTCNEFDEAEKKTGSDFTGPTCVFKALDQGIALGSAVKTASILNVDNRIMYRIGAAAMRLKLLPEASVIMGIPISAKGRSIYYDRPPL